MNWQSCDTYRVTSRTCVPPSDLKCRSTSPRVIPGRIAADALSASRATEQHFDWSSLCDVRKGSPGRELRDRLGCAADIAPVPRQIAKTNGVKTASVNFLKAPPRFLISEKPKRIVVIGAVGQLPALLSLMIVRLTAQNYLFLDKQT
jgi:hypothetical protein